MTGFGAGASLASAVAIVGEGPLGITLARSLARSSLDAIVFDAGPDPAIADPDLY